MIVWPGLRRSVSAISRLFNSASFVTPLTHTAVPTRAAPGTTGTFTRATTKTVENNDGYLVTGVAGEIGFVGARRVRNLFTFTEDIGNAAWTKRETTYSGGRLIETAATADHSVWEAASTTAGNYYVASGHAKADQNSVIQITFSSGQVSGDPKANFNLSTGALGTVDAGLTAEIEAAPDIGQGYYRFSVKAQAASTSLTAFFAMVPLPTSVRLANYAGNISNGLYLNKTQLEDVTAQTTQTAGEYVSVGVESAPYYHGSFVDGVKCFATDINGAAIPSSTLLGYQAEGARTNLCLQSNAFTTTWGTISAPTIAQNSIGPDGGTTAWTITDDSGVASEGIAQAILLTAATHTLSVFVKKTTGAQASYPVVYAASATHIAPMTIDTSNGVATAWSAYTGFTMASGLSATCVSYNDDFWRCSVTFTASAANWSPSLIPAGTTNATQSTGTLDVTAQGSAVFYGAQVELGSFASSYIPTTTVAVTRNADVLTYPSAGNIDGTKGWCYAEISADWDTPLPSNYCAMGFGTSIEGLITGSVAGLPTEIRAFDGTNSAQQAGNPTMYRTPRNTAVTWGGSSMSVGQSGVVTAGSFDGNIGTTAIGVGNSGAGAFQWFGTIRDVRIGQRQLSASELQAVTS